MEKMWMQFVETLQQWRSKTFGGGAKKLVDLGISANVVTFLSLLFGLAAVSFLFFNQLLFIILGAIHLLLDGVDGVLARASKPTTFGKYFDYTSDRLITLLILLKIGWVFQDYLAWIAAGVFLVAQMMYVLSRMQAPILFTRSWLLLFMAFPLVTVGYLVTGIASVYVLARQIQWALGRKN
jgi:phosphatidylglycerophosphate synthase